MPSHLSRRVFLKLAFLVEGGLIAIALGLAWGLEIPLGRWLIWNPSALFWGVGATLPLCLLFGVFYLWPLGSYRRIKDFLEEALGPSIAACRWYELLLVAVLAGVGEELLFRGVLQPSLERWGYWTSLILSNVVFGLLHAITVTYAILAFGMGFLLGLLMDAPSERSLLAPIITHGLYDFFAFCVIAYEGRTHRNEGAGTDMEAGEEFAADSGGS